MLSSYRDMCYGWYSDSRKQVHVVPYCEAKVRKVLETLRCVARRAVREADDSVDDQHAIAAGGNMGVAIGAGENMGVDEDIGAGGNMGVERRSAAKRKPAVDDDSASERPCETLEVVLHKIGRFGGRLKIDVATFVLEIFVD